MELIFEQSKAGRKGVTLPAKDVPGGAEIDKKYKRVVDAELPSVSEPEAVRHFTNLSKMNFGVDSHFYPLGSCTMKYNPKFTEEVAKKWSKLVLKIDIYEYDREQAVDKLRDSITIDISYFLFPDSPVSDEWEFDTLKVYSLNYLKLKITADKPLLGEFLRKKLNPLQLFILAAKDVPQKTDPKFLPIYTVCKFVDGQSFRTSDLPQSDFCKWMHKHVFLVGGKDPTEFAEQLSSHTLNLELHD